MLIILSIRCYDAQTSEVMIEPGAMQASILPSACREQESNELESKFFVVCSNTANCSTKWAVRRVKSCFFFASMGRYLMTSGEARLNGSIICPQQVARLNFSRSPWNLAGKHNGRAPIHSKPTYRKSLHNWNRSKGFSTLCQPCRHASVHSLSLKSAWQ